MGSDQISKIILLTFLKPGIPLLVGLDCDCYISSSMVYFGMKSEKNCS